MARGSIEGIVGTPEELAQAARMVGDSFVDTPNGPLVVVTRPNSDNSVRERHVAINIARPINRFLDRSDLMQMRGEPIAIVAGGPTVRRQIKEISKFKWVMTAGNAHDFVVKSGIRPSFAVATDPMDDTPLYFKRPVTGCSYLLASICPPALFDQLDGQDVQLWHFKAQVDPKHYRGEPEICWGCMVSIACMQIALMLGFQEQHYFGYDCSLGKNTHAYPVEEEERRQILDSVTDVTMGEGKNQVKFRTTTALICCMTNFYQVYQGPDGKYMKGYVHGGGLLWENIRRSPPEMKQWLEAV